MKSYDSKGVGVTMVVVGIICAILALWGILTGEVIPDKNSIGTYKRSEDPHDFWLQVGLLCVGSIIATGKGILIIKKAQKKDNP